MARNNDHTMQIRVPRALWARLRTACLRNDVLPSESIRQMVRAYTQEDSLLKLRMEQAEQRTRSELGGAIQSARGDDQGATTCTKCGLSWPHHSPAKRSVGA